MCDNVGCNSGATRCLVGKLHKLQRIRVQGAAEDLQNSSDTASRGAPPSHVQQPNSDSRAETETHNALKNSRVRDASW